MSPRILYVQSDDRMATAVERMLRDEGYDCDRARLGNEGVKLVQDNRYHLILVHLVLPDMDGYEFVRRIRGAKVQTPFLMQSAPSNQASIADRLRLKAVDHLLEPFNRQTLIDRIDAAFAHAENPNDAAGAATHVIGKRLARPLPGRIVFDDQRASVSCTIISVSAGGGAIQVDRTDAEYPDQFVLTVPCDKSYRCKTSWRAGNKIGVKFI